MKEYYTAGEIAAKLNVSRQTVYNWIRAGKLQTRRFVSNGRHYIPASFVEGVETGEGVEAEQQAGETANDNGRTEEGR